MIGLLFKALLSYMLGSVSGSLVVGAVRHVDIRESGSGNAGGTNAFRTQGFWFALAVIVIDIGKGAAAVWLMPDFSFSALGEPVAQEVQALTCGLAAVVGHCYPLWHGFRGGKGAATAIGALLVLQPLVVPVMVAVWLVMLVLTGYVGLATIVAGFSIAPAFALVGGSPAAVAFGLVLAIFIAFTHRSNIRRMREGNENRFEKIRVANWFR